MPNKILEVLFFLVARCCQQSFHAAFSHKTQKVVGEHKNGSISGEMKQIVAMN